MEQEAEPEGGPIADQYADEIHAYEEAIRLAKGDSGGDMTYDQAIAKKYGKSPKGAGPGGPIFEATEKSWNAIDVSRKAEKEIDNKEWNERTAKKLDMLKAMNTAGKFKKDWDEEKLQGWVDQNYSWEKLARQFKLNELYSTILEQGNTETVTAYVMEEPKKVNINSAGSLENVMISWNEPWGEERHTVTFEYEENYGDSQAYDECNTVRYEAEASIWTFSVEVCVDPNPNNEEIWDWEWSSLAIDKNPNAPKQGALPKVADMEEGTCGYGKDGKVDPKNTSKLTPGGLKSMPADKRTMTMMREAIRKEIKKLYENK